MHDEVNQKVKEALDGSEQVSLFTLVYGQGLPISEPLLSPEILKSSSPQYAVARIPK